MQARRVIFNLALVAVVALPSACGGGKEAISKPDFLTKANALCTTLNEKLAGPQEAIASPEDMSKFLTETLVPELSATTKAIRELGFPKGDEKLLGGLMDDTDAVLKNVTKDPDAAVAAEASPFEEINQELVSYGLTVCGGE